MEFLYGIILKLKENYIFILLFILLIVINDALILSDLYSIKLDTGCNVISQEKTFDEDSSKTNKMYVDVKGLVKKPGVYEVNDSMTVNDVIKIAGGLKKGASTKNINLSKKVKDEMVIIISSLKEIKKQNNVNNNITLNQGIINDAIINEDEFALIKKQDASLVVSSDPLDSVQSSNLININQASLGELQTLTGIGESKARAIIEYRNNNRFNKIEDIMNVLGIGEALFEKIKDHISV